MRHILRTQEAFVRFAQEALFAERWARAPHFLQSLDVRIKLAGLAAVLVTISLIHGLFGLGAMAAAALGLALVSGLGARGLRHPLWWAGPGFAILISLPAIFNLFSPGKAALILLPHPFFAVTYPGLEIAGRLVLRVTASVWWAGAVLLSSRWERVLAALRSMRIPALFVFALAMAYRYLFLFVRLSEKGLYARRSRALLPASAATERGLIGVKVASLFRRSFALATKVHEAMISRGFTGEYRTLEGFRLRARDVGWGVVILLFCAGIWLLDRSGGLG